MSSNTVTGNGYGFYLGYSSNNQLLSNNVSGNGGYGVYLASSSYNTVSGNNVSGNSGPGILLIDSSTGNMVSDNVLTGNAVIGIDVYSSSANTVSGNNVTGSDIGIEVDDSSDNSFYHNNFVDNTQQTMLYGSGPNAWDSGYPSGGNYWSDYVGTDVYKGPGQNVPGSDGIGDNPYVIDIDNTDNYPFMQPWTAAPASFVPLSGWTMDPLYTNAPYFLSSGTSDLFLRLDATDTNSRVTLSNLDIPKLGLSDYTYIDVAVSGTANAKILLRFFLDDGTGFDVVWWGSPTALDATKFNLNPYAGRTLTIAYVALMSSDGLTASIDITGIIFVATALPPVVPLSGWTVDSSLTNAAYTLSSTESSLSLELTAVDTDSRVTIYTVGVPTLNLGDYDHIDVAVSGTANARILLRFFLDDGSGFDVVYWSDPATLDAVNFDLSTYAGRTLTVVYIALMSSDGLDASIDITQIALVAEAPPPEVPLAGWIVDGSLTNSPYTLSSTESSLSLALDASDTSSRVTIYSVAVPSVDLAGFDHIDVAATGTSNARILLRFFLDDGSGFDVVYWADPATLNAISFDLTAYSGRTLTIAYIALMSSDGLTANVDITDIAFIATAPPPVVPLDGWTIDSSLTNAAYTLSSTETSLWLELTAVDTSSRVTIYTLAVPKSDLGGFDHIDVAVTGTSNARVLLRFFMDDGAGFDVVYWADPTTLDAISFGLGPYAGRTLTIAYIALMSSDGSTASIDVTQIALVA